MKREVFEHESRRKIPKRETLIKIETVSWERCHMEGHGKKRGTGATG
jgi:hypothetical protein